MKQLYLFFLFITIWFNTNAQNAVYDINFTSTWNKNDHTDPSITPTPDLPSNAHWSNLIGMTHKTPNTLMKSGELASLGLKNVAEFGNNVEIKKEINALITSGESDLLLQAGFSPFNAISSAGFTNVTVKSTHNYLSLVSMIAPSPDWFIAINSINLKNTDGSWKNSISIPVFAYDSGTDDGPNYDSFNSPNTPVGIFKITGVPINGNAIGTLTVTLKQILSVNSFDFANTVKISPNPAKDNLTITNKANTAVTIYNTFGQTVLSKNVTITNSKTINISELPKSVYLLELITGNTKQIKKLIVE